MCAYTRRDSSYDTSRACFSYMILAYDSGICTQLTHQSHSWDMTRHTRLFVYTSHMTSRTSNTLQHTATHRNTPQHTRRTCRMTSHVLYDDSYIHTPVRFVGQVTVHTTLPVSAFSYIPPITSRTSHVPYYKSHESRLLLQVPRVTSPIPTHV